MNEIIVNSNVTKGTINVNLEEIKAAVDIVANEYQNMVYDVKEEDSLPDKLRCMKEDRKKLNDAMTLLDNKRKEIKTEFCKPLTLFESDLKACVEKLEGAKMLIDQKIKAIEQEAKKAKEEKIREYYDTVAEEIPADIREEFYGKIFVPAWTNSTTSHKTYKDAIMQAISNYSTGMITLSRMGDFKEEGIKIFKETLDLNKALQTISTLEDQREKALARERQRLEEEAKRLAAEEIARKEAAIREEERRKAKIAAEEEMKMRMAEREMQKMQPVSVDKTVSTPFTSKEQPTRISSFEKPIIAIRLVNGSITEVFSNIENAEVVILDEELAGQKDIFNFVKEYSDMPNLISHTA